MTVSISTRTSAEEEWGGGGGQFAHTHSTHATLLCQKGKEWRLRIHAALNEVGGGGGRVDNPEMIGLNLALQVPEPSSSYSKGQEKVFTKISYCVLSQDNSWSQTLPSLLRFKLSR